jgi:hypothetical protein
VSISPREYDARRIATDLQQEHREVTVRGSTGRTVDVDRFETSTMVMRTNSEGCLTSRLAFVKSLVVSPESRRSATASCIPLVPGARIASGVGTEA